MNYKISDPRAKRRAQQKDQDAREAKQTGDAQQPEPQSDASTAESAKNDPKQAVTQTQSLRLVASKVQVNSSDPEKGITAENEVAKDIDTPNSEPAKPKKQAFRLGKPKPKTSATAQTTSTPQLRLAPSAPTPDVDPNGNQPETVNLDQEPNKQPKKQAGAFERAFLPAAEELEQTPAPFGSRFLAIAIAALIVGLLTWAIIGRVDIVVTAQGRTVSLDKAQKVQSESGGTVRAIHVRDGDRVEKGQVLVELDPTVAEADLEDAKREHQEALLNVAHHLALQVSANETFAEPVSFFKPPTGRLPDTMFLLAQSRYREAANRYRATIASFDQQRQQQLAQLDSINAKQERIEDVRPVILERLKGLRRLAKRGFYPRRSLDALEIEYKDLNSEEKQLEAARQEVRAGVRSLKQQEATFIADQKAQWADALSQARQAVEKTRISFTKLERDAAIRKIRAPKAGQVQERSVNTVGGVINPGDTLMLIAPDTFNLYVEATFLNKDIGFLRRDMAAEVKLEAFPFTRYGAINGSLQTLALDATDIDRVGPVYAAKVTLDQTHLTAEGERIDLTPGMNATVEIKTGTRRIIEYIISPLLRYRDEAARER